MTASEWAPRVLTPIFLPIRSRAVWMGLLLGDVEAAEGLVVLAVVVDHRRDRGAGFDQFDHGTGEGAAEVGLVGGGGLDVSAAR